MALEDTVNTLLEQIEIVERDIMFLDIHREDYPSIIYREKKRIALEKLRETKKQLKDAYLELLNAEWLSVIDIENCIPLNAAYNMARTAHNIAKLGWDFTVDGVGNNQRLVWKEE